jgi:pimeloyl-ACP methyl ester carboxylesterase
MSKSCRRVLAVGAAVLVTLTVFGQSMTDASATATSTSGGRSGVLQVPKIRWGLCPAPTPGAAGVAGFQCGDAMVPMDYAHPTNGRSFRLAVIKHPAEAKKLGTVFWNPGGPSDAGTQYLPAAIGGFPQQVRRRFDIVSWDPRGMGGRTTPVVQCFDTAAQEQAFFDRHAGPSIPVSNAELAASVATSVEFNSHCVARNGDLLAHVSTADNARDLDLLRRALGEAKMNYYGTSYGTVLGATYLNMFPNRVRSAVLDGAVFPTAWAGTDPADRGQSTFIRVGSDIGSRDTVTEFMNQCGLVDPSHCAFSAGSPQATQTKWIELLRRARVSPIPLQGDQLTDRDILSAVQGSIYLITPLPGFDRFPGWVAVAELLQQLWQAPNAPSGPATSRKAGAPTTSPIGSSGPTPLQTYTDSAGRQLSVICGESPNPTTEPAVATQARLSYQRAGLNGWPFVASCEGWTIKAAQPYLGPWNTPTRTPVLVIGNRFDPATPYSSSQRMAAELATARFLTVQGYGHTELLNPSRCAQNDIDRYILRGTLPPVGAVCAQGTGPFSS